MGMNYFISVIVIDKWREYYIERCHMGKRGILDIINLCKYFKELIEDVYDKIRHIEDKEEIKRVEYIRDKLGKLYKMTQRGEILEDIEDLREILINAYGYLDENYATTTDCMTSVGFKDVIDECYYEGYTFSKNQWIIGGLRCMERPDMY